MNNLLRIRSVVRVILLVSLLFNIFFYNKIGYYWDKCFFVLLGIGLFGEIILGTIIFIIITVR